MVDSHSDIEAKQPQNKPDVQVNPALAVYIDEVTR